MVRTFVKFVQCIWSMVHGEDVVVNAAGVDVVVIVVVVVVVDVERESYSAKLSSAAMLISNFGEGIS